MARRFLSQSHDCKVIPFYRRVFLIVGALFYCADVVTDATVAVLTLTGGSLGMGMLMMLFVVFPLVYGNYVAMRNRYRRNWYTSSTKNEPVTVFTMEYELVKGSPIRRSLLPWHFDSLQHSIFNILCLLQMGPIIDVIEMLRHRKQAMKAIAMNYSHFTYLRRLEVMIENCPQIAVQMCFLMNIWFEAEARTNADVVFRILSITLSVITLPLAIVADEEAGRFSSKIDFDMMKYVSCFLKVNIQVVVLYMSYFLMMSSRIILIGLLYRFCQEIPFKILQDINILPVILIEIHHFITFISYYVNNFFYRKNKAIRIIEELPFFNLAASFYIFSFSEVFIILLQFPVRYRRAIRLSVKPKDVTDHRFLSFYLMYGFNLIEIVTLRVLIWFYGYTRLSWIGTVCMMLYLFSGVFFSLYFSRFLHPDKLKVRHPYKLVRSEVPSCEGDSVTLSLFSYVQFGRFTKCRKAKDKAKGIINPLNNGAIANAESGSNLKSCLMVTPI